MGNQAFAALSSLPGYRREYGAAIGYHCHSAGSDEFTERNINLYIAADFPAFSYIQRLQYFPFQFRIIETSPIFIDNHLSLKKFTKHIETYDWVLTFRTGLVKFSKT